MSRALFWAQTKRQLADFDICTEDGAGARPVAGMARLKAHQTRQLQGSGDVAQALIAGADTAELSGCPELFPPSAGAATSPGKGWRKAWPRRFHLVSFSVRLFGYDFCPSYGWAEFDCFDLANPKEMGNHGNAAGQQLPSNLAVLL